MELSPLMEIVIVVCHRPALEGGTIHIREQRKVGYVSSGWE